MLLFLLFITDAPPYEYVSSPGVKTKRGKKTFGPRAAPRPSGPGPGISELMQVWGNVFLRPVWIGLAWFHDESLNGRKNISGRKKHSVG